jgi:hypothetical protein
MKFSALALELILLSSAFANPTPKKKKPDVQNFGNKVAYNHIWSDDFNGDPINGSPNEGRWKFGTGQYFSPGEQDTKVTYTSTPPHLQLSDHGSLFISPHRKPTNDGMWWSGKIETRREFLA